jgi:integrase
MTEKRIFTKAFLDALAKDNGGARKVVHDAKQRGLIVELRAAGSLSFYLYKRIEGRPTRIRLGRYPDMTIEQARTQAASLLGQVADGKNPQAERRAARHEQTLQGLFDHWLESHAKLHKKTWGEDQRQFDTLLKTWHSRRLSAIKKTDVQALHAAIGRDHGHYAANRCLSLLRAMFNKADGMGWSGINPTLGITRFAEHSRERFLLADEMKPFFVALKAEPDAWRDFWLLCLFTGARRGNVARMAWAEVDQSQGIWYVAGEQMKNGLPMAIVLPPPAVAILETRSRDRNGSPYVFPSGSGQGHIIDPRKSWARVLKAAGIGDLRPHDLRRSLGSWQAIAGASLQVIGASLGHRDPKATAVYARLTNAPVRQSVNGAVQAMIEAAEPPAATAKRKAAANET